MRATGLARLACEGALDLSFEKIRTGGARQQPLVDEDGWSTAKTEGQGKVTIRLNSRPMASRSSALVQPLRIRHFSTLGEVGPWDHPNGVLPLEEGITER